VSPRRVAAAHADLEVNLYGLASNEFLLVDDGVQSIIRTRAEGRLLHVAWEALRRRRILWKGHGTPRPVAIMYTDLSRGERPLEASWDGSTWSVATPGNGGGLRVELPGRS